MKHLFFIILLVLTSTISEAQNQEILSSDTIQILSNKINFYKRQSLYLSKQSKRLSRQIWKLNNKNKIITLRVKNLVKDSTDLKTKLDSMYKQNNELIENYEFKIQSMDKALISLKDSMSTLQVVKRDIDVIKKYFTVTQLSKRDYDIPKKDIVKLLKEYFTMASSPYIMLSEQENQIVVEEIFSIKKNVFFFFKRSIPVHGTYNIAIFSNPFDKQKTSLNIKQSFRKKEGNNYYNVGNIIDQEEREKVLLTYIDKVIYGNIF